MLETNLHLDLAAVSTCTRAIQNRLTPVIRLVVVEMGEQIGSKSGHVCWLEETTMAELLLHCALDLFICQMRSISGLHSIGIVKTFSIGLLVSHLFLHVLLNVS